MVLVQVETLARHRVPQVGPRSTVEMLIEVDQADLLYSLKDVKGQPGNPIARLTPLEWTGNSNQDGKAENPWQFYLCPE